MEEWKKTSKKQNGRMEKKLLKKQTKNQK